MRTRTPTLRQRARLDIEAAGDYYYREAGLEIARRFNQAVGDCVEAIAASPGLGSPLIGERLRLAGLKSRRVPRFPYLKFHLEQNYAIEIWRILHDRSGLFRTLRQERDEHTP